MKKQADRISTLGGHRAQLLEEAGEQVAVPWVGPKLGLSGSSLALIRLLSRGPCVRGEECGAAWKPPSVEAWGGGGVWGSISSRVRDWRCFAWEGSLADDVRVRQPFSGGAF